MILKSDQEIVEQKHIGEVDKTKQFIEIVKQKKMKPIVALSFIVILWIVLFPYENEKKQHYTYKSE